MGGPSIHESVFPACKRIIHFSFISHEVPTGSFGSGGPDDSGAVSWAASVSVGSVSCVGVGGSVGWGVLEGRGVGESSMPGAGLQAAAVIIINNKGTRINSRLRTWKCMSPPDSFRFGLLPVMV